MAGIPDATVDEIRAASDIVDVIGERVQLKKQGRRFLGLCPFHTEKSPSFSVNSDDGFYYCFGCLDADEPVWTRRGLLPIREVVVGDRVLGIDGAEEVVTETIPKRGSVLALHLASFRRDPLVLTPDHTCMVVRGAEAVRAVPMLYRDARRGLRFQSRKTSYRRDRPVEVAEVRADAVEPGDYVLFPVIPAAGRTSEPLAAVRRPVPELVAVGEHVVRRGPRPVRVDSLPVDEQMARLYGLWLAEGSVYRGGVRWSFHSDEGSLAAEVVAALRDRLGLAATVHVRPEKTICEVTCSNTHLAALVPMWFGRGTGGKSVPAEALWWPRAVQNALLDAYAYAAGDGTRTGERSVLATSISADLVRGLYAVAVQAGRPVSLSRGPHATTAGHPIWALSLRAKDNADSFYFARDGVEHYWCRVGAVEALGGERDVVDINVTGSRTFTTKLGAVHNCKSTGDVFTFVRETEGVGFVDAVRLLAARAGIAIPEDNNPAADRQGTLHAALRFAAGYYVEQLRDAGGKRARDYLAERAFTKEAVVAFGIGYAPAGWDALATAAVAAGFDADVLEHVGLVKRRESGGIYDVFRDRLVFPILSPIGKVLGFAGRILPGSPTASADYTPAKYLNTPETEIYHKSRVLFGMKQAKRAIRAQSEAVVVEGHADVVALWQAGVENVVAASGTALTAQQLASLAGLGVKRVVLLFDADEAGQGAARKGVETALDAGLTPYAVSLPDGADPDSFVRTFGADAFRAVLADERRDFVDFLVLGARRQGLFDTPEGKREAVDRVVSALARLRDPILAEEYLRRAARALDVYDPDLRREVDRAADLRTRSSDAGEARGPQPMRVVDVARQKDPSEPASVVAVVVRPKEETLMRLMLHEGVPMVEHVMTRMGVDEFTEGASRETVEALLQQHAAGAVDAAPFVRGAFGPGVQALASRVLAQQHDVSDNWGRAGVIVPGEDARPFVVATDAMKRLKDDRLVEAVEAAMRRMAVAEAAGGSVDAIQTEIGQLNEIRRQIARGEFLDWQ